MKQENPCVKIQKIICIVGKGELFNSRDRNFNSKDSHYMTISKFKAFI